MSAAITLSFGGVDFCLTPIKHEHRPVDLAEPFVSVSNINEDEIVISLNKFSGTLHVTSSLSSRKKNIFCDTASSPPTLEPLQKYANILSSAQIIDEDAIAQEREDLPGSKPVQFVRDRKVARNFDFTDDTENPPTQRSATILEDTPSPSRPKTKSLTKPKGQQRLNFSAKPNSKAKKKLETFSVKEKVTINIQR